MVCALYVLVHKDVCKCVHVHARLKSQYQVLVTLYLIFETEPEVTTF